MARVVSNTALNFNQLSDATGCPESIVEAQSFRTALQPSLDSAQICRSEPCRPPDPLRSAKRSTTAIFQLLCPATD